MRNANKNDTIDPDGLFCVGYPQFQTKIGDWTGWVTVKLYMNDPDDRRPPLRPLSVDDRAGVEKCSAKMTVADFADLIGIPILGSFQASATKGYCLISRVSSYTADGCDLARLAPHCALLSVQLEYGVGADPSALLAHPDLTYVDLRLGADHDLGFLAQLRALNNLVIEVKDDALSPIQLPKGLSHLKQLTVRQKAFCDLSPVADCPNLHELKVAGSSVRDLTPLKNLEQLSEIDLSGTQITDLGPLAGCRLRNLDLSTTAVGDLRPLAGQKINDLKLADTRVTDITPLAKMPLWRLQLSGCPIASLAGIEEMKELHSVKIDRTQVDDWAPLIAQRKILVTDPDEQDRFYSWIDFHDTPLTAGVDELRAIAGMTQGRKAALRSYLERSHPGVAFDVRPRHRPVPAPRKSIWQWFTGR